MIGFIGDVHLGSPARHGGPVVVGLNDRGRMILTALKGALDLCQKKGCKRVVLAGDLLDDMRPRPQLLAELRLLLGGYGFFVHIIKGNHDSASDAVGDNAVMVLDDPANQVYAHDVFDVIPVSRDHELLLVPFRNGHVSEWLPGVLAGMPRTRNGILCLHAGIRDTDTAPWLQDAPDAIHIDVLDKLMEANNIQFTFAGNWHEAQRWVAQGVHQLGALVPTGFSNLGISQYGNVAFLGDDETVRYDYVSGPRFLKFGPGETPAVLKPDGNTYFVEWKVDLGDMAEAEMTLSALQASGLIYAGSVLPDDTDAKASVQEASAAAKSGGSVVSTIRAYLDKLVVPGVDMGSVQQRISKYLST